METNDGQYSESPIRHHSLRSPATQKLKWKNQLLLFGVLRTASLIPVCVGDTTLDTTSITDGAWWLRQISLIAVFMLGRSKMRISLHLTYWSRFSTLSIRIYSGWRVFFYSLPIHTTWPLHISTRVQCYCSWCNDYRCSKWILRLEFKTWTRLLAFYIALIPLEKVFIQLFSVHL